MAGFFLDAENLYRNGGRGMRLEGIRRLAEAQGVTVVRSNIYIAVDEDREEKDVDYRLKQLELRDRVRRNGFHPVLKPVQRYTDTEGETVYKANADVDLAVDAMLQARNLD